MKIQKKKTYIIHIPVTQLIELINFPIIYIFLSESSDIYEIISDRKKGKKAIDRISY